jgi:hypothetical protein
VLAKPSQRSMLARRWSGKYGGSCMASNQGGVPFGLRFLPN